MKNKFVFKKDNISGLYGKLLIRIYEINKYGKSIDWSYFFEKLGRNFSIKKNEVREIIYLLRDIGFVDLSCKGVRLNFEVVE
jgi:transcription initiation factor IIE alpha subunit